MLDEHVSPKTLAPLSTSDEPSEAKLENKTKLLRWRQSWFVTDHVKPELLDRLGAKDLTSHDAQWEVWNVMGTKCCVVSLSVTQSRTLNSQTIWVCGKSVGRLKQSYPASACSSKSPDRWAMEAADCIKSQTARTAAGPTLVRPWQFTRAAVHHRDGLDLQRTLTVQELHSVPPQLLLPSPQDLAAGMDHLLQELRPGGTQILQTSKAPSAPGRVRSWRHTQDGQRIWYSD